MICDRSDKYWRDYLRSRVKRRVIVFRFCLICECSLSDRKAAALVTPFTFGATTHVADGCYVARTAWSERQTTERKHKRALASLLALVTWNSGTIYSHIPTLNVLNLRIKQKSNIRRVLSESNLAEKLRKSQNIKNTAVTHARSPRGQLDTCGCVWTGQVDD